MVLFNFILHMVGRIKEIIAAVGISDRAFAMQCGISQATLSRQLAGARELSLSTVLSILNTYDNISSEWLLKGEGAMFRTSDDTESANKISSLIDTISTLSSIIQSKDARIKELEEEIANLKKK